MSFQPKLHNAMWPGLVGKGTDEGQEPPISLEDMLNYTAAAEIDGKKFDGVDYFLFLPHTDPCLLYTSPSPRDATLSRMPSSA